MCFMINDDALTCKALLPTRRHVLHSIFSCKLKKMFSVYAKRSKLRSFELLQGAQRPRGGPKKRLFVSTKTSFWRSTGYRGNGYIADSNCHCVREVFIPTPNSTPSPTHPFKGAVILVDNLLNSTAYPLSWTAIAAINIANATI